MKLLISLVIVLQILILGVLLANPQNKLISNSSETSTGDIFFVENVPDSMSNFPLERREQIERDVLSALEEELGKENILYTRVAQHPILETHIRLTSSVISAEDNSPQIISSQAILDLESGVYKLDTESISITSE